YAGAVSGFPADSNNDMYVRKVLEPLGRLAHQLEIAVVLIGHWRKGSDIPSADRSHGSVGWRAVPRAVVQVARAGDGSGAIWLDKCNVAPTGHLRSFDIRTVEVPLVPGREIRVPRLSLGDPILEFRSLDEWLWAQRANHRPKPLHADSIQ